jgi:integrase
MISKSEATRNGYNTALSVFDHFAKDLFKLESGDIIIHDLKKLKQLEPAVYDTLQSFVNYLAKDRNPRTVKDYLTGLVDYFYYNGVKLDNRELRSNLSLPRSKRDMPYAMTKKDVKKILDNSKPFFQHIKS